MMRRLSWYRVSEILALVALGVYIGLGWHRPTTSHWRWSAGTVVIWVVFYGLGRWSRRRF